jgi:pSer/pThr/pTyr-binding forkhead associated (FHA) protein
MFSPMDLPLWDQQKPFIISRSHCRIECKGGGYFVRDLGSLHGTIVNGVSIGAEHPNLTAPLKLGENTITIGPAESQHRYWLMVE